MDDVTYWLVERCHVGTAGPNVWTSWVASKITQFPETTGRWSNFSNEITIDEESHHIGPPFETECMEIRRKVALCQNPDN